MTSIKPPSKIKYTSSQKKVIQHNSTHKTKETRDNSTLEAGKKTEKKLGSKPQCIVRQHPHLQFKIP